MIRPAAIALSGLSVLALAIAPLTPASADGRHGFRGRGGHEFGLVGALAGTVVGILTLPLAIAAAAAEPLQAQEWRDEPGSYPPQPGYYPPTPGYGPPAGYYSAPRPNYYYAPYPRYRTEHPRYTRRSGYYAEARPGYYHHSY